MGKAKEQNYWKRMFSSRGTVMLEFAFVAPLLIMTGLFIIEMLQYHDAALMADHTAWRIARMAAVRTDLKGKCTLPAWKKFKAEQLSAVLLMSTVTTGWGLDGKGAVQKVSGLFRKKDSGGKSKRGNNDNLGTKILGRLLDGVVRKVETFLDGKLGGGKNGRQMLFLAKAYLRVSEADVISVTPLSVGLLHFPLITTRKTQVPKSREAYLVHVSLDYPMRGGWMFPAFSLVSASARKQKMTRPEVHGRAVMLAEARIENQDVYYVNPAKKPGGNLGVIGNSIRKTLDFSSLTGDGKKQPVKHSNEQIRNDFRTRSDQLTKEKQTLDRKSSSRELSEKEKKRSAAIERELGELKNGMQEIRQFERESKE